MYSTNYSTKSDIFITNFVIIKLDLKITLEFSKFNNFLNFFAKILHYRKSFKENVFKVPFKEQRRPEFGYVDIKPIFNRFFDHTKKMIVLQFGLDL